MGNNCNVDTQPVLLRRNNYNMYMMKNSRLSAKNFLSFNPNTVDLAKKDPFGPVLLLTGGVTVVFLHAISNRKYVYPIEK